MRWIITLLLCCGGLAVGATERICLMPSDRGHSQWPCDVVIQPIAETDPDGSALLQSMNGENVMLWIGGKTQAVVDRFPALIQAAKQYRSIKSVYLFDEWGWDNATLSVRIGQYETEILWGAKIARAAGLQTVISILPQVILHPDFAIRDINAFSMIAIDVYPVNGVITTPGCWFDGNPYSTMLYCSYLKLLEHGYRGRIGYIAQGFAVASTPYDTIKQQLYLQMETIRRALALNVDALMMYGVEMGGPERAAEPLLVPLYGSVFESLVRP